MSISESTIFETQNSALGSYLLLNGIAYIGCKVKKSMNQKPKPDIILIFDDMRQVCRDLERVYINSNEHKFREYHKFLLKQVHQTIRESKE